MLVTNHSNSHKKLKRFERFSKILQDNEVGTAVKNIILVNMNRYIFYRPPGYTH